jgi:AcrR family transcriptional regulator
VPARAAARRPLSRDRVVEAALRLADRHGVEALSMRRLGAALHVEAMSLYKHVPDKAALLDAVSERVLAEFEPPPAGARWDARLRHVAQQFRGMATRHPHVLRLLATRAPTSDASLAPLEVALAALFDAGLDDAAALAHFWAFLAWMTGALLTETAAATGAGAAALLVPESATPGAHPTLDRLRARLADCDFEAEYARGLELALASVRRSARA